MIEAAKSLLSRRPPRTLKTEYPASWSDTGGIEYAFSVPAAVITSHEIGVGTDPGEQA